MPRTPFSMDPESPGSRFTLRPAIAVPGGDGEGRSISQALKEALGDDIFRIDLGSGEPRASSGGIGRGAEGFAAILDWVGSQIAIGVISGAAWAVVKAGGKRLRSIVRRAHDEQPDHIIVSRGAGALLAIDFVTELHPDLDSLILEAVEEPSSIAGRDSPEMNYVGIEPWLVLLADFQTPRRFVVAVSSDGQILGHMELPFQSLEPEYFWAGQ